MAALNRAVAVAEVDGPQVALAAWRDLDLDGYYLFHAIRADLLRRLGRDAEAALAYDAAIARTATPPSGPFSNAAAGSWLRDRYDPEARGTSRVRAK